MLITNPAFSTLFIIKLTFFTRFERLGEIRRKIIGEDPNPKNNCMFNFIALKN